ncbi:SubName: Full=Uncharacterized protein {ECO:0000313/EMBL:CCA76736.1}; Flags: Fragment [Serendipita indica DSM 11827]|nr:SubName: Full=Uncharacterized protein {ECO:0000313/EMBL:CCA76736.1}; Flags: Fragment [Serendipita indica DSM 11827]
MTQIKDYNAPLPFDIWHRILFHLSALLGPFSNLDHVKTLPAQRRLLSWETGRPYMKQWLDLRLVCREWADWNWIPLRSFRDQDQDHTRARGPVSWIHIDATDTTLTRFCEFIRPTLVASQIVTLSISTKSTECAKKALESGKLLPNVRNLSVDASCWIPLFWTRLYSSFPDVTTLRLRNIGGGDDSLQNIPEEMILLSLQYLELDNVIGGIVAVFKLPSLKHIVLTGFSMYRPLVFSLGEQLEYVSLNHTFGHVLSPWFWTEMSKLQVLELQAPTALRTSPPPLDHPFQYLIIQTSQVRGAHGVLMVPAIIYKLSTYSRIQNFSISTRGWTFWERMWLQNACHRQGIKFVELPAMLGSSNDSFIGVLSNEITRTLNSTLQRLTGVALGWDPCLPPGI